MSKECIEVSYRVISDKPITKTTNNKYCSDCGDVLNMDYYECEICGKVCCFECIHMEGNNMCDYCKESR